MTLYGIPIAFLALVVLFAIWSGRREKEMIDRNNSIGVRDELDHGMLTALRVGVIGLLLFGAWYFTRQWVPFVLMAYGLFTPMHRWTMNKARGLPWWYMDDLDKGGNWYDEVWSKLYSMLPIKTYPFDQACRQVARLAYGTETAAFLSGMALYVVHAFNTING